MKKDANYLKKVRQQYENFPYPARDPEREKIGLNVISGERLDFINYYYYSGRRDLTKNFRYLSAGGGTGDAAIFMAEQLRDTTCEVVYLDMSQTSMEVAKQRAKIRQLDNIKWVHGSILDIPKLGLGEFNHINCSGVLHHLEDPKLGLDALASVLKDDGAMSLMLYAKYGRNPIYQIQELMTMINMGEEDMQVKVDNCKKVIKQLPSGHAFNAQYISQVAAADLSNDNGIYDLFMHSQDRAYSVLDIYQYIEQSGLKVGQFYGLNNIKGNLLYSPETFISDSPFLSKVKSLHPIIQTAIAESMFGRMSMHDFSVLKNPVALPDFDDEDNIPSLSISIAHKYNDFLEGFKRNDLSFIIKNGEVESKVEFDCSDNYKVIFQFIDGQNTIGQIIKLARQASGNKASERRLREDFKELFTIMNNYGHMFLRHKSVPAYKSTLEMLRRVTKLYK